MQDFLKQFKSFVKEYSQTNYIFPETIGAKEGGEALLDLNVKVEMAKHFLKQALEYVESSEKLLLRLIEENLSPEKKTDIQTAIKEFIANAGKPEALNNWDKLIKEKFNSEPERIYIAAKLAEHLK